MKHDLIPDHWKAFVAQHSLVGAEIEFPWPGENELVAVIEILDDAGVDYEAHDAYPGIGVLSDGFVPVGNCSIGTGDPYFINIHDGPAGPLYKIDHALVDADGYNRKAAVSTMLASYHDLIDHRIT